VSGEVVEANPDLSAKPELVNADPYDGGWMIRVRLSDPAQIDELLDAAAYDALVAAGGRPRCHMAPIRTMTAPGCSERSASHRSTSSSRTSRSGCAPRILICQI